MRICDTPGCGRKHRAKGLCATCYGRAKGYRWDDNLTGPCAFDGCTKLAYNRTTNLCVAHDMQRKRGQELRPLRVRGEKAPRTPRRRAPKRLPDSWGQDVPKPRVKNQDSSLMRTVVFVPPTQPVTLAAVLQGLIDRGAVDLAEVLGVAPDQIRAEAARWQWWEGTAA